MGQEWQVRHFVKLRRLAMGLSIKDVSERSGLSPERIEGIESNGRYKHCDAVKLSPVLMLSIERLTPLPEVMRDAAEMRAAKKALGMTNRQIATKAGVSPGTVSTVLRGIQKPKPKQWHAIMSALGRTQEAPCCQRQKRNS